MAALGAAGLVESHLPLVRARARAHAGRGVPRDELVQVASLAALQAARHFDPARGTAFASYARVWIDRALQQTFATTAEVPVPATGETAAEDPAFAELERRDARSAVRRAVRALPPREREVVSRRFGLDGRGPATLAAVGAELGVSAERARQIEERALLRLADDAGVRSIAGAV